MQDIESAGIGINKAGVFRLLCGRCDKELFKTYEDENNYFINDKEQQVLKEIALNNALKKMYDLLFALALLEEDVSPNSEIDKSLNYYSFLLKVNNNEIQKIWDTLINDEESYNVIYKEFLSFKTPVAAQSHFPYCMAFEKDYSEDEDYIPWMNLAVLTLSDKTLVLLFTKCYDKWKKEFLKKENEEKRRIINNMILTELDDYFVNKDSKINVEFEKY